MARVLLVSKQAYVRYISHELRTPLNAATLGLKLMSDDLERYPGILNQDHPLVDDLIETLTDSQLACAIGVNILNDLLDYDKLQSGVMELHKETIMLVPFVTESLKMFSGQARAKGVELTVQFHGERNEQELPLSLNMTSSRRLLGNDQMSDEVTASDSIFGDRYKLEQVLRNLISNAIKFSPSNAAIQVQVYYKREHISPPITSSSIFYQTSPLFQSPSSKNPSSKASSSS